MARVVVTATADMDTDGILAHLTVEAGYRTASKYNFLFENPYNRLTNFPGSGAPRPALGQNIRIGIVLPYIVIYRHLKDDDTVTVLRVIHGRRRITRKSIAEAS